MIESQPYRDAIGTSTSTAWLIREPERVYAPVPKTRLLDQVRHAIRTRHYSSRTEEAYVVWIKRFIFFHGKRHPAEMGKDEWLDASDQQRRDAPASSPRCARAPAGRGAIGDVGAQRAYLAEVPDSLRPPQSVPARAAPSGDSPLSPQRPLTIPPPAILMTEATNERA